VTAAAIGGIGPAKEAAEDTIMPSKLDELKAMSVIVADTGDIEAIRAFQPTDCTTNPSLILSAARMPAYAHLVDEAVRWGAGQGGSSEGVVSAVTQRIAVNFGAELLAIVPGRVSTEVDADRSFDSVASFEQAQAIVSDYEARGFDRSRLLMKLAATWEGIRAAERLERVGINCNLTLLFSFAQAKACAEAGVFLISPFVGRILDWHVKATGRSFPPSEDPGVLSVRRIFEHYKSCGYATVVMAASFRNIGEIEALAGIDRLTISLKLLQELAEASGPLTRALDAGSLPKATRPQPLVEPRFRLEHNADAMATEKLAEGIRAFIADLDQLRAMVRNRLDEL
jgi:transaldolase